MKNKVGKGTFFQKYLILFYVFEIVLRKIYQDIQNKTYSYQMGMWMEIS